METVGVLVDIVASEPPMNGTSSSLGNGGSHHTSSDHSVTNGYFKEEEIIDTKMNRTVQFAKDEVLAIEPTTVAESAVIGDTIVEVNGSELEGDGQTENGFVEDNNNNNNVGGRKHKQLGIIEGDESSDEDEEVEEVELEFENVIPKLHDHNAHCPNCDAKITKVILRRRIPKKILTPSVTLTTTTTQQPEEERELVGCLSCFSIFMPKGKTLHPFPIFEGGADNTNLTESSLQPFQSVPKSTPEEIGCDPFAMFRSKGESGYVMKAQPMMDETPSLQITYGGVGGSISDVGQGNAKRHGYETLPLPTVNSGDMSITIRDIPLPGSSGLSTTLLPITEVQSNSPEIVKSIVYGGLAETITSLGVVSSAAASGASTLNIVALGLANLIGGLLVLAQNLANLKNDQQEEKYKEALGRKERFFQHATIAMISYLVFGLVPPIVYGFTFQDTDDKDFKLIALAAASLICIVFLAIGKAYIAQKAQQLHKFSTYFNYVVYYVATAAMVSGVGYVVGDQAKKVLEKYGWLLPKDQATNTLFLQGSQSLKPSFASF